MLFFCMERNHKSRDPFISVLIVNTTETIRSVNICEHYGCSNCCISFGKNKEQLNKHTNISWIKKSAKSVKIIYILVNSAIDMWETFMCRRRHKQTETGEAGSSSTTQGHKVFFWDACCAPWSRQLPLSSSAVPVWELPLPFVTHQSVLSYYVCASVKGFG